MKGFDQLCVAARWNRKDKLELATTLIGHRRQLADIVEAEQAAVGYEDDALDGETLQDAREHPLEGLGLDEVLPGFRALT